MHELDTHRGTEDSLLVRPASRNIAGAHERGSQTLPARKDGVTNLAECVRDQIILFGCFGDDGIEVLPEHRVDAFPKGLKSRFRIG